MLRYFKKCFKILRQNMKYTYKTKALAKTTTKERKKERKSGHNL